MQVELNQRQMNMLVAIIDKELDNAKIQDMRLSSLIKSESSIAINRIAQYTEQYEQNGKYIERLQDIKKVLTVK